MTRRGLELNNPLIARVPLVHGGTLPKVHSFVKAGPANVILSALKKEMGYAERGLILRLYETAGAKAEAKIELPWPVEASEADLIERPTGRRHRRGHDHHGAARALRDQDDPRRQEVKRRFDP